jgi:hypothetical protein
MYRSIIRQYQDMAKEGLFPRESFPEKGFTLQEKNSVELHVIRET